jgi:hypothetical protein
VFEQQDELLERVVGHLKRPVQVSPELDGRVMAEIAAAPVRRAGAAGRAWRWLVTPRRVPLSPLAGLAFAAGVAFLVVTRFWQAAATTDARLAAFQFVLVAPQAASVSLVGDFNDWDPARTPMSTARPDGLWTAVLPLAPGRYRYAFLVDGQRWLPDPAAPRAGEDEFGVPSSVVTVGET